MRFWMMASLEEFTIQMPPPCCPPSLSRMTLLAMRASPPPLSPSPPPHEPQVLCAMRLLRTMEPEPPRRAMPPPPFPPLHPLWTLYRIWLFLMSGPPLDTPMPPPSEHAALLTIRFPTMVGDEPET